MGNAAVSISDGVGTVTGTGSHPHERPPEMVDGLPVPAQTARVIASQVFHTTEDRYAELDDARAHAAVEQWITALPEAAPLISFGKQFPTTDRLIDSMAGSPLGMVTVKDEISDTQTEVPLLESPQASLIRDRMTLAGILPMYITDEGQVVFALRVDEHCQQNLSSIQSHEVANVVQELDRLLPGILPANVSFAFMPVSQKTYGEMQLGSLDSAVREGYFTRSCDTHFVAQVAEKDLEIRVEPLSVVYPGGESGTQVIEQMHFSPFILLEEKSDSATAHDKNERQELWGICPRGKGIFDDAQTPVAKASSFQIGRQALSAEDQSRQNIRLLLDNGREEGFIPLKIEHDSSNRPIIYIGFRAYQQGMDGGMAVGPDGCFQKIDLYDLSVEQSLRDYLNRFRLALREHLPADLSLADVRLVPVPNPLFDNLYNHISNPEKRKNTLKIIDTRDGVSGSHSIIQTAVDMGTQDIIMNLFSTGPKVKFGRGSHFGPAPFRLSRESYVKIVGSLIAQMAKGSTNLNSGIQGQISFRGAVPADFIEYERCRREGVSPTKLNQDSTLTVYPPSLHNLSFRLQYELTVTGAMMAIRVLDMMTNKPPSLEECGLRPEILKAMRQVEKHNLGMVFVAGPTGCGKTTLQYALVERKNDGTRNIITMESPVEAIVPGIAQIEINEAAGRTREKVFDDILRMYPNIIMVGEIRNLEEADTAIKASLSGHLSFATVHTNDAPDALVRLVNMGIDPSILADGTQAIIAQRLLPKFRGLKDSKTYQRDPSLITRYDCSHELEELIGRPGAFEGKPIWAYKPKSSLADPKKAFEKRLAVNEVVLISPGVKEFLRKSGGKKEDLVKVLRSEKYPEAPFEPMVIGGLRWVLLDGVTSVEALYGDKGIPYEQFRFYADWIIEEVKSIQAQLGQ